MNQLRSLTRCSSRPFAVQLRSTTTISQQQQHRRHTSTDTAPTTPPPIKLPTYIPRGPTDILNALSATVGSDPTAAHYKYHDDPYLMPVSNMTKRTYAMSQEAGRKAAKWIRQQHPDLFQHSNADPPIAAYRPTLVYTEETDVTIDSLRECIANTQVTDAALVYRKLSSDTSCEIPAELKQQLLELICFHNHEDPVPADLIEERWHSQQTTGAGGGSGGRDRQRKTWRDNDLAEQLFADIQPPTLESYAALIRGMARYCQVERAWSLFQEATAAGHRLDVATYNSIIAVANFLKESGEMRWQLVREILQRMADAKLRPDIGTLNACMQLISTIGGYRHGREFALATLAEFRELGVQPSLGTWYYVLSIFCRERGPTSHVLRDVMAELERDAVAAERLECRSVRDTWFFVTAMDVCRNHLGGDRELAKRVDRLLHRGNNYDLMGDSYKESIYYRHLFALMCAAEPLEVFMAETYDRLVPHVYTPEPGIMAEVLKQVDVNGALELVPRLWSDMVQFDHVQRVSLLEQVLKIMVSVCGCGGMLVDVMDVHRSSI